MNTRAYTITSSVLFGLLALVNLLRLIWQWDMIIGGWHVPTWASVAILLVAGFLSYQGVRLLRKGWLSWLR